MHGSPLWPTGYIIVPLLVKSIRTPLLNTRRQIYQHIVNTVHKVDNFLSLNTNEMNTIARSLNDDRDRGKRLKLRSLEKPTSTTILLVSIQGAALICREDTYHKRRVRLHPGREFMLLYVRHTYSVIISTDIELGWQISCLFHHQDCSRFTYILQVYNRLFI